MSDPTVLPPAVRRYLHGFVVRGRRLAILRGAGLAAAAFLGTAIIWCVADRYLQFDAWVRLIGLLSCVGLAALLLVRPIVRVTGRQTDWVEAAERIERQDPRFGQRLVTVISRLLGRPEHRGSDEIIEHLVYQLDQEAAEQNSARLLPSGPSWRPWLVAAVLVGTIVGLTRVEDLRFTTLARRFASPLSDIPPVTTTHLLVSPGNVDLKQGQALQIEVTADRLGGGQVWAHLSADGGRTWSRAAMTPATESKFTHTVLSVDRDLLYFVTGGDAVCPRQSVRVLRRPAVAEFDIRYVYPASTGKPPLTVTNTDGVIEAPVGTEAAVTIRATEPLQSAMFTFGGEKTLTTRAARDEERQFRITVLKDGRYELDLISTREQTGSGPSTMQIKAVPDRPPVVRVVEPGDGIRLSPRDILPMAYEAFDDYGLEAVGLRAQVGTMPAIDVPVESVSDDRTAGPEPTRPDVAPLRRKQGVFHVDLATMPLTVGDIVTLTLTARDTAGSPSQSDPIHILVSPRSIDLDAYERMAELEAAAHLAETVYDELEAARRALADAGSPDKPAEQSASALARMNRRLASAQESSSAMRRALLRGTAHADSPALADALAGWVDQIQALSVSLQSVLRGVGDANRQRTGESIGRSLDAVRTMREELRLVSAGLRAEALEADRENLAAAAKRPTPQDYKSADLVRRMMQRTREEVNAGVTRLGLKPEAGDLDAQLKARVDAARGLISGRQPVDFASAVREWSQRMQNEPTRPGALEERLSAAAQAEAIRPDADPSRARDLQLAARTADVLAAQAAMSALKGPDGRRLRPVVSPATWNQFASAVATVQREHQLRRASRQNPHRNEEVAHATSAANEARSVLARMIGETDVPVTATTPATTPGNAVAGRILTTGPGSRAARAEALALAASAEAAGGNFAKAGELDAALVRQVRAISNAPGAGASTNPAEASTFAQQPEIDRTQQQIARATAAAQASAVVRDRQKSLAEETASVAAKPEGMNVDVLAAKQGELAAQIADAAARFNPVAPFGTLSLSGSEEANWRERGVTTLVGTQAQLAMLPDQISKLQEAQNLRRSAARRADEARRQAENAPADQKTAAQRAAQQARADEKEAAARLDEAARPVSEVADAITSWLDPFAPEATPARDIVAQKLAPALKALVQSSKIADSGPADRAAADARQGIEAAQRELSRAQETLAERDPMVAAKSYAKAATEALLRKPPDFQGAERHQRATAKLLNRVWDMSLRRASTQRLAIVPAVKPLLTLVPPPDARSPDPGKASLAARDWRRLRPREQDPASTILREVAPPEYDAALDLYFKMLNKGREK